MKIQLKRLSHQIEALQAINKDFYGVDTTTNNPDAGYIYANPIILMPVISMLILF